ncbi:hypothetical protein BCR34DRAFT_558787 [Clohesyomyces aquaticus]|uniref:Uncharacterized protein n=1 Tax=Clohesyomyces aquaticus TaxID=1231657 RepID=A0A1Y1ZYV7_9PLEO|nr:hypothetical protein BCR34DRAFT_558787 [Clohesyomyces aquaticus]
MPVLADTDSLRDLLRACTPETEATNGTFTLNGSLNTSKTRLANEADEFEKVWENKQRVAAEALKSRFGELPALNIAQVLFAIALDTCGQHTPSLSNCCLTISTPPFVERVTKLRKSFGERFEYDVGDTYCKCSYPTSWEYICKSAFNISPLDAQWHRRKSVVREGLEGLEKIRARFQEDQRQVNAPFDEYLRPVEHGLSVMINRLRRFLVELDLREDTLEEAIENGGKMDPPGYEEEGLVYNLASPPYPYRDQTHPRIHDFSSKPATYKMLYSFRFHVLCRGFRRHLGSPRVISVIMSVFCIAGLAANIHAVYKCSPSDRLPVIDSNFWSALSQTTIGIAAIYSLMIPQLQSGWSPIPRKWRWLFNSFLFLSVLTALLATAVYPWHGRVSITAAFISSLTQLAVTLQMILSSGQKIRNVRIALDRLGNSDIYEVRRILDS